MSACYLPVGWNRAKVAYDAVLVAAIAVYVLGFTGLGPLLQDPARPPGVRGARPGGGSAGGGSPDR